MSRSLTAAEKTDALASLVSKARNLKAVYRSSPLERIGLVKRGIPARALTQLSTRMNISKNKLYTTIGVATPTMNHKIRINKTLGKDESEGALGIAMLIGQVESIVNESGKPDGFDAATWTARWLDRPQPSLGGRPPGELMDTADGRALVSDLLARVQSGAYG